MEEQRARGLTTGNVVVSFAGSAGNETGRRLGLLAEAKRV